MLNHMLIVQLAVPKLIGMFGESLAAGNKSRLLLYALVNPVYLAPEVSGTDPRL
jgi:hypothetical protein